MPVSLTSLLASLPTSLKGLGFAFQFQLLLLLVLEEFGKRGDV